MLRKSLAVLAFSLSGCRRSGTLPRGKARELCRLVRALGLSERENRPRPAKGGAEKEESARVVRLP